MKLTRSMSFAARAMATGLILLGICSRAFSEDAAAVSLTTLKCKPDAHGNLPPEYLAQRLGVAQKFTALAGVNVREKCGLKCGNLDDLLVDLHGGRVFCAVVSEGGSLYAFPGRIFESTDKKSADLDVNGIKLDLLEKIASKENASIIAALPQSYSHFSQPVFWDTEAPLHAKTASQIIGASVVNGNGETLGRVVNLMVDLPTSRVVFAVVSYAGKKNDLYAVPPQALQNAPKGLVLNAEKSKIESIAHSDGFFWSNMSELGWSTDVYHRFGVPADFEANTKVAAK